MKLSSLSITIIAFVSVTLVVMSDMPLNDMLGEHPLQSELSFVEGHVKKAEQQKNNETKKPKEKNKSDWVFLSAILMTLLFLALGFLIYQQLSMARKYRSQNKSDHHLRFSNMAWGLGAFFFVTASYYFIQAQHQSKELAPFVEEMLIKKKQGGRPGQHELEENELVQYLSRETQRRNHLAKIMATLGLLTSLTAFGLRYSERNTLNHNTLPQTK
jgi:hypothetical protein